MKFAVIVSRFNPEVCEGLLAGAIAALAENGVSEKQIAVFRAPGAFEIPLLAQTAAETRKYDGIICLGAVIKGGTAHFEFISLGATVGILQSSLKTQVPITFGILTAYSDEQALERSRPGHDNKGREAALACIESLQALSQIRA